MKSPHGNVGPSRAIHATKLVSSALVLALALTPTLVSAQTKVEEAKKKIFANAVKTVSPSVVQIQIIGGLEIGGQVVKGDGQTTGLIVDKDGYILSSTFNFINKPTTILVTLPNPKKDGKEVFPAKIVSQDHSRMLTLLQIEAKDLPVPKPVAKKDMKTGQYALAVGRTYDLKTPSVSVGIISALDRIWDKALQTDAKVSPVNYGGPLVDVYGKVFGILVPLSTRGTGATAGVEWYDSGIGFAIPYEDALAILPKLKKGDIHPGSMGITFTSKDMFSSKPVLGQVVPKGAAAKAGLKSGDEIVEADGRPVTRPAELRHILGGHYAGDTIKVKFKRAGKEEEVDVTLAKMPKQAARPPRPRPGPRPKPIPAPKPR